MDSVFLAELLLSAVLCCAVALLHRAGRVRSVVHLQAAAEEKQVRG